MSRHVFSIPGVTVVVGLDAPLNNFFAQVHRPDGEAAVLRNGAGFEASDAGLLALLDEVGRLAPVPPTVQDSLKEDLSTHRAGGNVSYEKHHVAPSPDTLS